MRTAVIYKSKTGFTKKYAEWISEELSADLFELPKVSAGILTDYDTVIFGGGLHAGGISGLKYITKNIGKLQGKKVIVFATGASPAREEIITEIKNKNFTAGQQKQIQFFYLRGGFDYNKLKAVDKILMTLMKMQLKKKKELTPDESGMLAAYDRPVNFTEKENINDLIIYVNS